MNILVITSILPAPITSKKGENDVLLTTASFHEKFYPEVRYHFLFLVPYSNIFSAFFSKKWKEYRRLRKERSFELEDRTIDVVGIPALKVQRFNEMLTKTGYRLIRKRLRAILYKKKIDVIHAHNVHSNAILAAKLSKDFNIPFVITSRALRKFDKYKITTKVIKEASAVVNFGIKEMKYTVKLNSNSYLIPHGIDEKFLHLENVEKKKVDPLKIVTLTRLLDLKNIDKVFSALESANYDFIYDIYGEGPDKERLLKILEHSPIKSNISFKGKVPYEDVPKILTQYHLFVLPSYFETFGRVYIEAMACGIPVIGAKGCGIDGYIQNKKHGFLVDHRNIKELSEKIDFFQINLSEIERMGLNAKELASQFSWESIIKKLNNIYLKILLDQKKY